MAYSDDRQNIFLESCKYVRFCSKQTNGSVCRMSLIVAIAKRLKEITHKLTLAGMASVTGAFFWLILIGTAAYSFFEGWSWPDALYATIITVTTVGYGDLSPQTVPGRIFTMIFALAAIGLAGYAISNLAVLVVERQATRRNRQLLERRMKKIAELDKHVIICGANRVGQAVAVELHNLRQSIVIIDLNESLVKEALLLLHPEYFQHMVAKLTEVNDGGNMADYEAMPLDELAETAGAFYITGDPSDESVLVRAGIERAKGLIPCLRDDRDNLSIVVGARVLAERCNNTDLQIMSRVESYKYMRKLLISGAHQIRLPTVVSGYQMASHLINPVFSEWWSDMMLNNTRRFGDAAADDHPDWVGKNVADLRRHHDQLVIAIKRDGKYISAPLPEEKIRAGDVLVLLGNAS